MGVRYGLEMNQRRVQWAESGKGLATRCKQLLTLDFFVM